MGEIAAGLKRLLSTTAEERKAVREGRDAPSADNGQNYLMAPEGHTLTQDADRDTSRVAGLEPPQVQQASLSGNPMGRRGLSGTLPTPQSFAGRPQVPPPHKMSPDELLAYAKDMLATQEAQNSHAMAQGPSVHQRQAGTPESGYNSTRLGGFEEWKQKNAPHDSGDDYDLDGAYAAGESPVADGHWSDRFKKPNHETFSNESQYADYEPGKAGSWSGDTYQKPGEGVPDWLTKHMEDR